MKEIKLKKKPCQRQKRKRQIEASKTCWCFDALNMIERDRQQDKQRCVRFQSWEWTDQLFGITQSPHQEYRSDFSLAFNRKSDFFTIFFTNYQVNHFNFELDLIEQSILIQTASNILAKCQKIANYWNHSIIFIDSFNKKTSLFNF